MSAYDGQDLFGSGPHEFTLGPWQRQVRRRGLAGVAGELTLDLGLRGRALTQTGRLQAATAAGLHARIAAVEARADGTARTLVDDLGHAYERVILESFRTTGPLRRGRGCWCEYEIVYRQLP